MPRPPREAIALQRRSGSAILDRQPAVIAAERETLVQLHATLDLDPLGAGAVDIVVGAVGAMAVRADCGQGIRPRRAGDEIKQVAAVAAEGGNVEEPALRERKSTRLNSRH